MYIASDSASLRFSAVPGVPTPSVATSANDFTTVACVWSYQDSQGMLELRYRRLSVDKYHPETAATLPPPLPTSPNTHT